MTYGWALIIIVTLIGALVFMTSETMNTNVCTTFLQFICKGIQAEGDTLVLVLQNATGQAITINPFTDIGFNGSYGYAVIVYKGKTYQFEEVTIEAGGTFTIRGRGQHSQTRYA